MLFGQEPAMARGRVEDFRPCEVGGVKHRPHDVFGATEQTAELSPMSAELPQLHQFFVGDEAQRAAAIGESFGDVVGVVGVGLTTFAPESGQFRGVGDVHLSRRTSESGR